MIPPCPCLLRRTPRGWELTLLPATQLLPQLRQPGFKHKMEFLYRKLELQPNKTRASTQLPQQRRGTWPGVTGTRVHVAVCKRIWRPQVVSGWVQDKSRRLQPSARAGAAQSGQGPRSLAPQAKPVCHGRYMESGKASQARRPVPMDAAGTASQTSQNQCEKHSTAANPTVSSAGQKVPVLRMMRAPCARASREPLRAKGAGAGI